MNRRSFLRTLGLAATAVSLSPLLDLAEIIEAPSAVLLDNEKYVAYIMYSWKMHVSRPAHSMIITNISEGGL